MLHRRRRQRIGGLCPIGVRRATGARGVGDFREQTACGTPRGQAGNDGARSAAAVPATCPAADTTRLRFKDASSIEPSRRPTKFYGVRRR